MTFVSCSLSDLVENFSEGIHKIKCKYWHDNKKSEIKYKDCECYLEYTNVKDELLIYRCLCCNGNYQKKVWWRLKEAICYYYTYIF